MSFFESPLLHQFFRIFSRQQAIFFKKCGLGKNLTSDELFHDKEILGVLISVVDATMKDSEAEHSLRRLLPLFEKTYNNFNRREFVSPDPLELLYPFQRTEDREVAGLLVSSIAYGRVTMILRNARRLLEELGASPAHFLRNASCRNLERRTEFFRHRFTTGGEIAALLGGMGRVLREFGSLEGLLDASLNERKTIIDGVSGFVDALRERSGIDGKFLLPSPQDGSACKRMFLFFKWMVRRDAVDPGGWTALKSADLLLPMDVHLFRICTSLGLTDRKQPNLKTAMEVTSLFRKFLPDDPAKFDFILTRFGIRKELDEKMFINHCLGGECYCDIRKE